MQSCNVAKGQKALEGLKALLVRSEFPTFFKLTLIRAKLIPVLLYGAELWGMQSRLCVKLQKVLDIALRMATQSPRNVSKGRLLAETQVAQLAELAASRRLRGFNKFPTLNTWCSILINNPSVSKNRTWLTSTKAWIKRYLKEVPNEDKKHQMTLIYATRQDNGDKTLATAWAKSLNLNQEPPLWIRLGLTNPSLAKPLSLIGKIRLGIFPIGQRLVHAKGLGRQYLNKCPVCEEDEAESIVHLILHCKVFDEERRIFLLPVIRERKIQLTDSDRVVSALLGGEAEPVTENVSLGAKRTKLTQLDDLKALSVIALAKYLKMIVPKRYGRIAPKLSFNTNELHDARPKRYASSRRAGVRKGVF